MAKYTNEEIKKALSEVKCGGDICQNAIDLINRLEGGIKHMTEQRDTYMQEATEFSQKVDRLEAEIERLQTEADNTKSLRRELNTLRNLLTTEW